jgi:hypothetical protein
LGKFEHKNGRTLVNIELQPKESVFVVFREKSKGIDAVKLTDKNNLEYTLNEQNELIATASVSGKYEVLKNSGSIETLEFNKSSEVMTIKNEWKVQFLKEYNYDSEHTFTQLTDWKDHNNEQIKYYSGTAIYRNTFKLEEAKTSDCRYILDLGKISVIAQVFLNGKDMGVMWLSPFEVDITDALVSGNNDIEIHITNQWTNRLIGDERFPAVIEGENMPEWFLNNQPMPESERTTYCTYSFYKKHTPLLSAGLLGPVTIKKEQEKNL